LAKQPLALTDPGRTEFGFSRTLCGCAGCVRSCLHIPGYLIPGDLERIRQHLAPNEDLLPWAQNHLLASPGALVLQRGHLCRIPTIVPARRSDGPCFFLTAENRCRIHVVAPFGCAFFDSHQPSPEADRRSKRGLQAILEAWRQGDVYAEVWLALHEGGRRAPSPEVCRQQLRQAWEKEKLR